MKAGIKDNQKLCLVQSNQTINVISVAQVAGAYVHPPAKIFAPVAAAKSEDPI